ncbi:unnamed protein product [Durusdinium trenchii]|uniref:Carrier domain-containing protein n=1 Tax=Durusdinium trenchii TaxID=1381693 RepID=A0ABP0HY10_9DINO
MQVWDWEISTSVWPQASGLDRRELGCAEKYQKQVSPGAREMVSAAQHLEEGRFEEGAACAERALGLFREAEGESAAIVDACRLVVYARQTQGRLKDAHELAHAQLEAFAASDALAKARMLLLLSQINHDKRGRRNRERAKEWASAARSAFAELGETRLEVIKQHGNPLALNETKQLVDAALPLLRAVNDCLGEGVAMHGMACARALAGLLDGAADAGREALALFRKARRRGLEAFELHCLAAWMLALEDTDGAIKAAEEAMQIYMEEPCGLSAQPGVLQILMKAYFIAKDFSRAFACAQGAFERFQEANDRRGQAVALDMLALGYLHSGDFGEAAKLAQQQASLLQEHGDRPGQARALRLRCRLSVQLQDFNGAIAAASEAAAISGDLRSYPEKAAALQLMADCQMRNHSLSEAREAALQARQLYRDLLDRDQEVLALLQASQCSALSGDTDLAMQTASEAKELAKRAARRCAEGICWHTLASLHLDWGRLADASKMAKKALTCAKRCHEHKEQARSLLLFIVINLMISKEYEADADAEAEATSEAGEHFRRVEEKMEELRLLAQRASEPFCTACSSHAVAAVQLHRGSYDEALRTAQTAMTAYEESADLIGVLHMYLLMGKAHLTRRSFREARDATEAACWFGEQLGFRSIEENARTILQEIQAREAELPEPQLRRARVPEMPNVPKLDVQALDVEVLRDVVQLFVKVLIGSDDPIDPERPLMEMGLTSHLAVVLRDHLAKVLPGLSPPLPVTLIYDYPSITSITQLVTTSAEASRVPEGVA